MPPRLRDVVALPDLGLTVFAGASALDHSVRWVAVSELEDPGPFLEGGELVLTTGMRLPTQAADCSAYVARLVAADAAALGLGVGLSHAEVPAALVAAAEAQGLPLVRVPEQTPFIAVTKAISRLLAAEEYDEAARGFTAQRELIRSALTADDGGPAAVVTRLAKHVGGFALVLDPAGSVVHASPASAVARATELAGEVARLRPKGLLASAVVSGADEYVVLQPLGVRGRARGFLAVGAPRPLSANDQAVVNLAVSLLSLALARSEGRTASERGVRAAAVRLLLDGHAQSLPLDQLGWTSLRARPVRVVVVRAADADPAALAAAEERLVEVLPGSAVAAGLLPDDPAVVLAVAPAAALDAAGAGGLAAPDDDLVRAAGVGDAADVDDPASLGRSLARARRALAAGADGLRRYDDLGGGLEALLDPAAADAWAAALLAPLDEPGERADLAATLHAWLGRHGQVDAAAADLGVHRHTVRHRLRRAEALLDRSLDDPGVRAELWLALTRTPT
ncbi:PucR family transcriptional regulator ligand-binding domain-containing protein [Longivirga aurantiaca]|uniref:PucR family transcriptional regulator ligand-binding domain-containing protein n=1 Tax=Longivirga aurantiaca TaxID=1837743 RepID=A0ABW1SZM8_9ACTN